MSRCRPLLEELEDRCVLTTTATFAGGVLTVTGDGGNNSITITEQATPRDYQVAAADLAGSPLSFSNVRRIVANSAGGTDLVTFSGNAAAGTRLAGPLTVSGTGALDVFISNQFNVAGRFTLNHSGPDDLNATVAGSAVTLAEWVVNDAEGDSDLLLFGARVIGQATFKLGDGTNNVIMQSGARVGGRLTGVGGADGDSYQMFQASSVKGMTLNLGAGLNQMFVSGSTVAGPLKIVTAGSNEVFSVQSGSLVKGAMNVTKTSDTGLLNVFVASNGTVAGALSVVSANGGDFVQIDGGQVGGSVKLNLQGGGNQVDVTNGAVILGTLTHTGTSIELVTIDSEARVQGSVTLQAVGATALVSATITDSSIRGSLTVRGGGALDVVNVLTGAAIGGNLTLKLAATGSATLNGSTIAGNVLQSGTGVQTLQISASWIKGSVALSAASSTNAVAIAFGNSSVGAGLSVRSGSGNDNVDILDSFIGGATSIVSGDGLDEVNHLNSTHGGAVKIDAGAGDDGWNVESINDDGTSSRFMKGVTYLGGDDADTVTLGLDIDDLALFFATASFNGGGGANTLDDDFGVFLAATPVISNFTVV